MAKLVLGPIVATARNKLGEVVFAFNRGGQFSRTWLRTPNPNTTAQQQTRAALAAANLRWQTTLTASQRLAWNNFAIAHPQSDSRTPGGRRSGHQWFTSVNARAARWLGSNFNDPPLTLEIYEPGPIASVTINADLNEYLVQVTNPPTGTNVVEIWTSAHLSGGITRLYKNLFALAAMTPTDPNPINIWDAYCAKYGIPPPGTQIGTMVRGIAGASAQEGQAWTDLTITGGTSEAMLQTQVTLTDAQIKSLPTTPVALVGAPGAGKLIVPLTILIHQKTTAGAYTNITAPANEPSCRVNYADGSLAAGFIINDSTTTPAQTSLTDLLGAHDIYWQMLPWQYSDVSQQWGTLDQNEIAAAAANTQLQIQTDNSGTGNYTGGNAANTWIVTTFYAIAAA